MTQFLTPPPGVRKVIDAVSAYYNLTPHDLFTRDRRARIAHARQVAMYLCRFRTRYCLQDIGKYLGGRDHTTVLHGVRAVTSRMLTDDALAAQVEQLFEELADLSGSPVVLTAADGPAEVTAC